MKRILTYGLVFTIFLITKCAALPAPVEYYSNAKIKTIGSYVALLDDPADTISIEEIMQVPGFLPSKEAVPSFPISRVAHWVRFSIKNNSNDPSLLLELAYPTIDSVWLVQVVNNQPQLLHKTGEFTPIRERTFGHQNYVFELAIAPGATETYYLKVRTSEQLQLPLYIGNVKQITERLSIRDLVFGLYAGLIFVMFLYNLFVYFTVRDKSYLYYVIYIIFVGFTQACVQGYSFRFLYPDSPHLANLLLVISPSLLGLAALRFLNEFMMVKKFTPKLFKVLYFFVGVYFVVMALGFAGYYEICAELVQINAGLASVFVIIIASIISREYRPAKFFLLAWSVFLASVVVFVSMNFNVLPYNEFTYYSLQIGSALEVVLLSFALADKINILRKEKEESQIATVNALRENDRIIREQNIILEGMVEERTHELTETLSDLKEAQGQLVESEKMASLGQLTAGIAHEINNPINFVISNVNPLRRDIDQIIDSFSQLDAMVTNDVSTQEIKGKMLELKEEIEYDYLITEIDFLLKGISDGSQRTAEIVKGLRIFARLDEHDLKRVNINEGLDSTTIIVNSLLNNKIVIQKDYEDLPLVECNAGKLNQVFLNIITNGIHAIRDKFKDKNGGIIKISTKKTGEMLDIIISDNGAGMSEEVQHKVFEPFFTTKEVGEGTGLGLSIAYNVIKKHNGKIHINSVVGEGTEFVISIPFTQE